MSPDDFNAIIFNAYSKSLGKETRERIIRQIDNYEYYSGRQHRNECGELVKARDMPRPPGRDYDATRYATNYFRAIGDRKARWQMSGKHGVAVPRTPSHAMERRWQDGDEPTDGEGKENERT